MTAISLVCSGLPKPQPTLSRTIALFSTVKFTERDEDAKMFLAYVMLQLPNFASDGVLGERLIHELT